jgi:hypothetical protein
MSALETGPLAAVIALGALHGINPAMGWLFAVALGLQEKKGSAVWRALPPLALGHALSVAVVVGAAVIIGSMLSPDTVRIAVAFVLAGFGVYRLVGGHGHARVGGMRVGAHELALWSFLMATAHGAGLMVLPFVMAPDAGGAHAAHLAPAAGHVLQAGLLDGQARGLTASLLHTLSYLLTATAVAALVYWRFGVRLLRTAWINLDLVWAGALIVTAVVTVVPLAR